MPVALSMRSPTDEEWKVIEKLVVSRTAPLCQVKRANLIKYLAQGSSAPKAAAAVGVSANTARSVLHRFNQEGLRMLEDRPRSGRPPTLTEEGRGRLVSLAKSPPQEEVEETEAACHWTLETLLQAAHGKGISIGRTHLWRVLNQEGIRWWQRARSWLSSDDPEFPEKRERLRASTRSQVKGGQPSA